MHHKLLEGVTSTVATAPGCVLFVLKSIPHLPPAFFCVTEEDFKRLHFPGSCLESLGWVGPREAQVGENRQRRKKFRLSSLPSLTRCL